MQEKIRLWLIEKLGGYPDAESAIDMVDDLEERKELLTMAVRKLFNTIGPEDILKEQSDGTWRFGRHSLTEPERNQLIAEAKQFSESKLWHVLTADIKWQANRKTFIGAKDELDFIAGKLWQYTFDCINTRLKSIAKKSGMFNIRR